MKKQLTQERLKSLLEYSSETGEFRWVNSNQPALNGCVAGHISKSIGYRFIGVDGYLYLAHRLAWLYVYGVFPSQNIDHIDRNKDNNSMANLRLATQAENALNSKNRSTNKSGYRGVSWCGRTSKWRATVTTNGKQKSLGRFKEMKEAVSAYNEFAKQHHGEFANVEAFAAQELGVVFYDLDAR